MDKTKEELKALYHKMGKKYSLNGIEKQIFWALVQSEICAPRGVFSEELTVLMNFRRTSSILHAYEDFHQHL